MLGLGRAVGEAIAVSQVIGGAPGINSNLFLPAQSAAGQIAAQYQGERPTPNRRSRIWP